MTFEEYNRERDLRWQRKFLWLSFIVTILVFIAELGIMVSFILWGGLTEYSSYFLRKVLHPTGLNLFSCIVSKILVKKSKLSLRHKNLVASLNIVVICSSIAIFHNYFNFLLLAVGVPFFLCTVFADKTLFNWVFVFSLLGFLGSSYTMYIDSFGFSFVYKITTLVCYAVYLLISFIVGMVLIENQKRQIDFICQNYHRQNELMEELKIDGLTQLYNRVAMDDTMESLVEKKSCTTSYVESSVLVLLDIDFFKKINDTYGHACGDRVLVRLSNIIRKTMGSSRNAFRFGGEEFILIFNNASEDAVFRIVKSIQEDFESSRYDFAPEKKITVSAGIASLSASMNSEQWFNAADKALYESKNTGRNKITVYKAEL